MFPEAFTMTPQTPMLVAGSLHPHLLPSPHPTHSASQDPVTSSRDPEHFIFALRATFAMELL